MGIAIDEEDTPDSYLCEQCGPADHTETLQALKRGERIWDMRNKIYQNERKMSKNRKGKQGPPGWLKKDVPADDEAEQETGTKRKRSDDVKTDATDALVKDEEMEDEQPARSSVRQDKRRKSSAPVDPETEIVDIDQLPQDRQKVAVALSKILADDIKARAGARTYRVRDGDTPASLGAYYAARIEYALKMNHGDPSSEGYRAQFRTLNANLKKNKLLIERLLKNSLTADELSTMSSSDMASEELQKERAAMKEQLDRQAIVTEADGPRYRRTHKGDELIEDENAQMGQASAVASQPVRERTTNDADMEDADTAVSPTKEAKVSTTPLNINTRNETAMHERRTSSQQFDMNTIWAKTAQSPTSATPGARPMQMPPRRRSSVHQKQPDGTKVDADVDRMLQDDDDDETYSPAEYADPDAIVWRGKLVQAADAVVPTVVGRYVAGRDISRTVTWDALLPDHLTIDGRLAIDKAEDYLCSLSYSSSSDVSVLALTPDTDPEGFATCFAYFKSRQRYAVVKDDKPAMVKDLYIIPFEPGEAFPAHVSMLEYNSMEKQRPLQEKCLLATFVIGRAPDTPSVNRQQPDAVSQSTTDPPHNVASRSSVQPTDNVPAGQYSMASRMSTGGPPEGQNGQQVLPQHMRTSTGGPSGSPLNTSNPVFSPSSNNGPHQPPPGAYGSSIPPNPYGPTPHMPQQPHPPPYAHQGYAPGQQQFPPPIHSAPSAPPNSLVYEILGPLSECTTAQAVVSADPHISREKLLHLKAILDSDEKARTDLGALSAKLFSSG